MDKEIGPGSGERGSSADLGGVVQQILRAGKQSLQRTQPTQPTFLLLLVLCGVGFANHGPDRAKTAKEAF